MSGLFNLFIRNIRIDWPRIERHSYLRNIPAIAGLEEIDFKRNITFRLPVWRKSILSGILLFLSERTAQGSPRSWKRLPWRMVSIRRAAR